MADEREYHEYEHILESQVCSVLCYLIQHLIRMSFSDSFFFFFLILHSPPEKCVLVSFFSSESLGAEH